MNDLLGVTVDDLVASLKTRRLRIPAEIGAFVALETCEALMRGPAIVRGADVRIAEDGAVSLFVPPNTASADDAARSVCAMLASLLVAAGTGVPPMLIGLVERGPSGGAAALERLRDDLESALVPLNRGAARRVLSRMIREARRASIRPEARLDEIPEDRLDAALDDLLGGPSASDPDLSAPAFSPSSSGAVLSDPFSDPKRDAHPVSVGPPAKLDAALDDLLDLPPPPRTPAELPPAREHAPHPEPRRADRPPAEPRPEPPRVEPRVEPPARPVARPVLDEMEPEPPRSRGGGLVFVLGFLLVGALTIAGVAVLRPDLVDRALGREPPPETPAGPTPEERAAAEAAHRARFGTLTVRSTPDRAQVLMLVGRGPAIARDLPTGMAYELVAIADGRAPSRAIVPASATWESTPEGARYELAMQTADTPMASDALVLGDTQLPRDALGTPSATLGSVRVVTTPPGAKVYLLVGFTPDVQVQNVRTDEITELLVFAEGHRVERVLVAPSDWVAAEDGGKTADVSVTLTPARPTRIR